MSAAIGIIPARFGSTRFPGKPLVRIGDQSMIERVYRQAQKAALDRVIVATDDERIALEVRRFDGEVAMTAPDHESGTARCREVVEQLGIEPGTLVVNVQGDEPFIKPGQINKVLHLLQVPEVEIATLVSPVQTAEEFRDPNRVKVVLDKNEKALYFSRAAIPHVVHEVSERAHQGYIHLGIYGFKASTLLALGELSPGPLEQIEKLEQLGWLWHGYSIYTAVTHSRPEAIDSPADLEAVLKRHFL